MLHVIVLDTQLTGNWATLFLEWYGQHNNLILTLLKIFGDTSTLDCRRWCIGPNIRIT